MPLVFVHGVNVREGHAYDREVLQRNQNFQNIFYKMLGRTPHPDAIMNPYWGSLATSLTPGNPFLPKHHPLLLARIAKRHLELSDELVTEEDSEKTSRTPILGLARSQPLRHVIDLLLLVASDESSANVSPHEVSESLSKFAYGALQLSNRFKTVDEQVEWLEGIKSDEEFFNKLEVEVENADAETRVHSALVRRSMVNIRQAGSWVRERIASARSKARRPVTAVARAAVAHAKSVREQTRHAATSVMARTVTHPARRFFHDRLFLFIGDSFLYFGQRGTPDMPGEIITTVTAAIEKARQMVTPEDPELIVVAHSMGGNIVCDATTFFDLNTDIDVLITVGSQFPLFADLHMFHGFDSHLRPIPKPQKIKRWINVFDPNDFLGFAAEQMFEGVVDVEFASGKVGVSTHADYFKRVSLYECMARAVMTS